jgi:hypothetical protein
VTAVTTEDASKNRTLFCSRLFFFLLAHLYALFRALFSLCLSRSLAVFLGPVGSYSTELCWLSIVWLRFTLPFALFDARP